MKGHLRLRRPGVWEISAYVGRDPLSGRERRRFDTVQGTKRDAQRALAALVTDVWNGSRSSSDATVADLLDRWLTYSCEDLSPTTVREYRRLVAKRINPAFGSTPINRLKPITLDAFYLALRNDAGLSPASIRQVHSVIRRAFKQAAKWGWVDSNPAVLASPPRIPRPNIQPPSIDAVSKLVSTAESVDASLATFVYLAAATGLRRAELCALRWHDLDVRAGTLLIARTIVCVPDGLVEKDPKTHAARRIALDDSTLDRLAAHRSFMADRTERCGLELTDESFVFSYDPACALPWHPDTATAAFRRLVKKAGLTGIRLHDLRHMHATQLLAAGVPVRTVSGRLGHANAATTLNVYAHFLDASDRDAADTIGELLRNG